MTVNRRCTFRAQLGVEAQYGLLATSEDHFRLASHLPRTRSIQKSVMPLPIPIIVVSALGGYRESRPVAAPFSTLESVQLISLSSSIRPRRRVRLALIGSPRNLTNENT